MYKRATAAARTLFEGFGTILLTVALSASVRAPEGIAYPSRRVHGSHMGCMNGLDWTKPEDRGSRVVRMVLEGMNLE